MQKDKNERKITLSNLEFVLIVLIGAILGAGITFFVNPISNTKYKEVDPSLQKIVSMYNQIVDNYYENIDYEALTSGAIEGMLNAVGDPYTAYMKDNYDNFNITLNGAYEGVGIEISKINDKTVILGVFASSPAKEAGLEVGDVIIKVDDKEASTLTTDELSKYIRETNKSKFKIVVERDGKTKEFTINKKTVVLKSVKSEVIEKNNKKIGYIYMSIFALNTYQQFKDELNALESKGIDALIVDLRANSGGELNAALNITSLFMDKSNIIYQIEDKEGNIEKTYSKGNENKKYKIVVLVDENTASAAEVLTAALKENLGATVIGKKTYGKGTVQTLLSAPNGEKYKITTSRWLTPSGDCINEKGIMPDIEVSIEGKEDTQLLKAVEYIVK